MEIQFPSPQEIYDLSTDQLNKLKSQLQHCSQKSANNQKQEDEIQKYKQLLESIEIQIDQRQTIQFFTQLCEKDGTKDKYVKQITDFNNQLKKLAQQLIKNQQGSDSADPQYKKQLQTQQEPNSIRNLEQQLKNQINKDQLKNTNLQRRLSQTSIYSNLTSVTEVSSNKDVQSVGTESSQLQQTKAMKKKAGQTTTKKMCIGGGSNMKKNKNKMTDFIKATLSRTNATQYVSSKGGIIKKSPQKPISNSSQIGSNSHLASTPVVVNKSNNQPKTQKNIQNTTNMRNKPKVPTGPTQTFSSTSTKSIPFKSSQKSIKSKDDQVKKKRQEALQKMKNMKKPQGGTQSQSIKANSKKSKGTTKGMNAKSLLDMVKQDEQRKKKKEQSSSIERINGSKNQISNSQKTTTDNKENIKTSKTTDKYHSITLIPKQLQDEKPGCENIVQQQIVTLERNPSQEQKQMKEAKRTYEQEYINQQINPVLSSSDNEDQLVSVKIGITPQIGQRQKDSNTGNVLRDSKSLKKNIKSTQIAQQKGLNSIQQQSIEQSMVFNNFKATDMNQNRQSSKMELQTVEPKKQHQFGKITVEEYNAQVQADDETDGKDQQGNNYQGQQGSQGEEINLCTQNAEQTKIYQSNALNQKPSTAPKKQQQEKQQIFKTSNSQKKLKNTENKVKRKQKQPKVIDEVKPTQQQPNKKCYNEDYWLHIKQEAEAKILRFKQEKQLQQKEKVLKQEQKIRIKKQKLQKQKQKTQEIQRKQKQQMQLQQISRQVEKTSNADCSPEQTIVVLEQEDDNDKFIEQQKLKLKKLNQMGSSGQKKKAKPIPTSLIKQPKISYPKPQFNYLDIYPTFNHMFNVFYTKKHSQALLDIPLVMKELIAMFGNQVQYLNSRKNAFKPAIFLPFDNRNKLNQLNDARQLLQHAETTYINLKTMIQRLETFNSNIQGQFQNTSEEEKNNTRHYRVVKSKEQVYDIITTSFLRRKGWKELPHGQNLKASWNLFWSWSKPEIDMNKLLIFQRVNHFPFNKNLTRKDLLYKNIQHFRKTHKISFPYLPLTFNLPKQFTNFSKKFHQQELLNRDRNYWIMKPIGKSRGRGIKVINSLGDLNYVDNIVVQKYIANPLLLDGYKFDMRIYVLVTSFHPLEAFIYKQGFARLSTQKYSLQPMDMKNNFVHLTNFSINRHNQQAAGKFSGGSKISMKALKEQLTKMGYSFTKMWEQIHQIVIKSLLACSVSVPPFPAAFQLYGYDVMIDKQGQCSLIEANASPSLERSFLIDQIIKQSLIDDIVNIVDPPSFSREELINVMQERLSPDFRNIGGGGSKKKETSLAVQQQEDLIHIARIMKYQKLRKYGQIPENIGLFEMAAPCDMSRQLEKVIKSKSGINNPHNID